MFGCVSLVELLWSCAFAKQADAVEWFPSVSVVLLRITELRHFGLRLQSPQSEVLSEISLLEQPDTWLGLSRRFGVQTSLSSLQAGHSDCIDRHGSRRVLSKSTKLNLETHRHGGFNVFHIRENNYTRKTEQYH